MLTAIIITICVVLILPDIIEDIIKIKADWKDKVKNR